MPGGVFLLIRLDEILLETFREAVLCFPSRFRLLILLLRLLLLPLLFPEAEVSRVALAPPPKPSDDPSHPPPPPQNPSCTRG